MSARADAAFLAAALAAAVLCWAPSLSGLPVYDDGVGILQNPRVRDAGLLLRGFLAPADPAPPGVPQPLYGYRPLTEASFRACRLLGGGDFRAQRAGSLLAHLVSACLVFLLARRLRPDPPAFARWTAGFFAVHPISLQAVAYVYQRATILEALLAFACLWLYDGARRTGSRTRFATALACALLACGAKETAMTLPLLLAAWEWVLRDGSPPRAVLARLAPFAAAAMIPAGMGAWAQALQHDAAGWLPRDPSGPGSREYFLIEIPVLLRYLAFSALPFPMRFYWNRPETDPAAAALCGAALGAGLAWAAFGPTRHRLPRLALALFLAPLALESSFLPIQGHAWLYRCVPSLFGAGLLFALAACRLPAAAPLLAAALLAAGAAAESARWADPAGLQFRDARHAPRIAMVRATSAWWHLAGGRYGRAERLFRTALRAGGDLKTCEGHLYALHALGRHEEAARETEEALRRFRGHMSLKWIAWQEAWRAGDEDTLDRLAAELQDVPILRPELLQRMVQRRIARSEWALAESILQRHLDRDPGDAILWDYLGWVRLSQGVPRYLQAEEAYRRAVALDPSLSKSHYHIGQLCLARGDLAAAEDALRRAVDLRPDYAKARAALAQARERRGRDGP